MRSSWIGFAALALAAVTAVASCRRVDDDGPLGSADGLVAFDAQIGGAIEAASRSGAGAASKAVEDVFSKSAFADNDKMGFFLSLSSGKLLMTGNLHARFSYDNLLYTRTAGKFTTAVGSPAGTIYYPYRTTPVDLWGIYPYDANATSYSADAYPWTVAADQSTKAAGIGSDFLVAAKRSVVPNNTGATVDLNFCHRMSLVLISIAFPDGDIDGKTLSPTNPIAEIYLDNLKTEASVNLNTEAVAPKTGATAKTMIPYHLGNSVPKAGDTRPIDSMHYQAIVVPQSVAAGTKSLVRLVVNYVNSEGNPDGQGLFLMPIDAKLDFETKTAHTLSLSFDIQKRLRLETSGKLPWDKNASFNFATNVWEGDNKTIVIGGVTWAKGFLMADGSGTGCKIGTPLDQGLFFQFGSLVGWDQSKTVKAKPSGVAAPAWNSNYYATNASGELWSLVATDNASNNGIGDACRFYLGSSWRIPTAAELFALTGKSTTGTYAYSLLTGAYDNGTAFPGKAGAWWGPKFAARDTLTTPYMLNGGYFVAAGTYSNAKTLVWSSTTNTTTSQSMSFDATNGYIATADNRQQGAQIRCVWIRKIYTFDNPAMSGTAAVKLRFGFNFPCAWTLTNNASGWLTLSAASGTATIGDATKTVTMTPTGATATTRTGTITITGTDSTTGTVVTQTITVTQNP